MELLFKPIFSPWALLWVLLAGFFLGRAWMHYKDAQLWRRMVHEFRTMDEENKRLKALIHLLEKAKCQDASRAT